MNRIDIKLAELKSAGKKMLSPYITAGDPDPNLTVDLMHALVAAGADILEIGIPFSDPMAEGPVIQAAMERALRHGVRLADVFSMMETFRLKDQHTPVILMSYMNPIEQYGNEAFAERAKEVGVDGVIMVDIPPEESQDMLSCFEAHNLYPIFLCSPTTTDVRMNLIKSLARGYVYYVSLKGVTGSHAIDLHQVHSQYLRRKTQIDLPVMVGFGIKTSKMAADVAEFADGVIVGAALISQIQAAVLEHKDPVASGAAFVHELRCAIDKKG